MQGERPPVNRSMTEKDPMSPLGAADSILDTIGGTPVVRLSRLSPPGGAAIHLKLEFLQPTGSLKDRTALGMIEAAEREGLLSPGATVIEATGGNTGIALAQVCAVKGYKLMVTMPESASLERRALLQAYGAKVELTPEHEHLEGARRRARELLAATPDAFMPDQFSSPAAVETHVTGMGAELVETVRADGGRIDACVVAVGTGAAVTGVGRALKAAFPEVQIVAVEPAGSEVLAGGPPGPHRIQGMGAGYVPDNVDRSVIDVLTAVSESEAWEMKVRLAREEGLLVGISTGATVVAARRLAETMGPEARIYTLAADTGERYFSMARYFA